MDFHPWIQSFFAEFGNLLVQLQCCHGFSSMDTSLCLQEIYIQNIASMLPWIFIHGYQGGRVEGLCWKWWLQCCHGFSSMDTEKCNKQKASFHLASMLPWIFIHGYSNNQCESRLQISGFNVAMDFHP